jgi:hydroxymethylglutaryl-CoA lyase
MTLPKHIRLVEVGPRDGLQNEPTILPAHIRARLIERLADTGLKAIEAGSFVPPRAVPQMAGTADVLAMVDPQIDAKLCVLAPNMIGLDAALAAGAQEIALLTAASESFSLKNLNRGIAENLQRIEALAKAAHARGVALRGYISCAFGCPFEGEVDPACVVGLVKELDRLGCDEISLGDTIGVGTPFVTRRLVETVARVVPVERLAGHFHDTYGQALANIFASLDVGVRTFDSSVAGLGGCPYAPGATGNVATEDVVYMFRRSGLDAGVDLDRLLDVSAFICAQLGRPPDSRVARAMNARRAQGRRREKAGDMS